MTNKLLLLPAFCLIIAGCDTKPNSDNAKVSGEKTAAEAKGTVMTVDTKSSKVSFVGFGVGKNHPGKFTFKSGEITVNNDEITSGTFVIDINSMTMDQPGEMYQVTLRNHLVSEDFFNVTKYPEAIFVITKVEPFTPSEKDTSVVIGANTTISGNLTLTGVTKNVRFPAKVIVSENFVQALADFSIDRTEWKMNYNADKEKMKEKFISHDVNIKLDITGRR